MIVYSGHGTVDHAEPLSLNTRDATIARRIASQLREFRQVKRDKQGRAIRREAGGLPFVRAIGWYTDDHNCAQISTNLTDYRVTGPHLLLRKAQTLAAEAGVKIIATELIGCLPRQALFNDLEKPIMTTEQAAAALLLGPNFDPAERVLENQLSRLFPGAS